MNATALLQGRNKLFDNQEEPNFKSCGLLSAASLEGSFAHGSSELALLDRMPVGLAIHDARGELLHSNAHFDRLVGCSRLPSSPDPLRLHWRSRSSDGRDMSPEDFPCRRALRGEIVSPGIDLMHVGRDGEGRWLNVSAAPIVDPGIDTILGIVLLYVDAHEAVQATMFSARAERRFKQFAENSAMAIWIADAATGEFVYRNPLHLGLVSPSRGTFRLDDWLELVNEQDRAQVRQHYIDVRGGRTEQLEYGMRLQPDGKLRRLRERGFPIRDDAGAIISIGGMTDDITPAEPSILYLVGQGARSCPLFSRLLRIGAGKVKTFASLAELLDVAQFLATGCVVVDLVSTSDAGDNLPRALAEHAPTLPMVLIGAPETHAATAVAAMRAGAADYLIPPLADDALLESVALAVARCPTYPRPPAAAASERIDRLSKREREVLAGLKCGGTNKSIARSLGISPRTVELHRSHLMERLNANSLAELLQMSQQAIV